MTVWSKGHASAWCFLIFTRMMLSFCFCRNRKKLHASREVLNKLSGLLVAALWMGGEEGGCVFHAMGGHHPHQTSPRESRAHPQDQEPASPWECFSVEGGMGWNWGKILMPPWEIQAVNLWQVFYCLFNVALHYGFREGDLFVTLPLWFWVGQRMLDALKQEYIFIAKNFPELIFHALVYVPPRCRKQKATNVFLGTELC